MTSDSLRHDHAHNFGFLAGGGEMGALMRTIDWSATPVGPIETWPQSLRTTVRFLLHSKFPMFLWWGPDLVQFYNDGYRPSFGRAGEKHPQAMGQRGEECWQEIWPIIKPQIDQVRETGVSTWNENHLVPIYRNGILEEVYWTYTYSPVFDESGNVGGVLVVVTETTKQVLTERRVKLINDLAIATSGEQTLGDVYTKAVNILATDPADIPSALIYVLDDARSELTLAAHTGLDASPRARPPILRRREDAPLESPWPVWHVLDTNEARDVGRQSIPSGEPTRDSSPDAAERSYLLPLTLPTQREPLGVLIFGMSPQRVFDDAYREFFRAITRHILSSIANATAHEREIARQRELEQLRVEAETAQERLQTLFSQAPVAIAIVRGPRHVIELANPRVCQIWGRTPEQVLGKPLFDALPEASGQGFEEALAGVLATGVPFIGTELPSILERNGHRDTVYWNFVYEPWHERDGTTSGVIVVATDVSEQVTIREQIERERQQFTAMVAHELRNPLTSLIGYAQLLRRRERYDARAVEAIIAQAGRLERLTVDLRDTIHAGLGTLRIDPGRVDPLALVRAAVEQAQATAEAQRIQMETPTALPEALWDADRIMQVLGNLLLNAIKYTGAGEAITVSVNDAGEAAEICIRDHGIGIPDAALPRIFDPFYRATNAGSGSTRGMGLGLPISKALVEAHGGSLTVVSAVGSGSTFTVRLPYHTAAVPSAIDRQSDASR